MNYINNISIIEEAIKLRKPISFNYIDEDKDPGTRLGNPHIIYYKNSSRREDEVKVDIYQTAGVSDAVFSGKGILPDWRPFKIIKMTNVVIKEDLHSFSAAPGYNPSSSPRYDYVIEKI